MKQAFGKLTIKANRRGLTEFTTDVSGWLQTVSIRDGMLTIFCQHTSASLLIQENAAPDVRRDLEDYFARIAPEEPGRYAHDDEGPDDMPAHVRTALTQVHLSIPIIDGRLALGTWQGIYLFEHRRLPHPRALVLHLIGD